MSFLEFCFLQVERERERERESGIQNLGIKEKLSQSYLSYFTTGFHWRIFLLSRANRLCSIFLHWLEEPGSLMSQVFFCLQPGILAMVGLPATNPAQKLAFLLFTSAEGKESPLPFWGPNQSFGFSLLPLGVQWPEVTKYQHLVSPVWPTFLPNGHSLTARYC